MARTNVPVIAGASNGTVFNNTTAGMVALDPTNGHVITPDRASRRLLIVLNSTFAGSKTVTLKAGAYPPASKASQGDLVITLAATATWAFQQIDSSRFAQADGTINIDVAASATGFIACLGLAKL